MTATVLAFPTPAPKDGGKARLLRAHPNFRARNLAEPICDLTQRCADPEDTAPAEYSGDRA